MSEPIFVGKGTDEHTHVLTLSIVASEVRQPLYVRNATEEDLRAAGYVKPDARDASDVEAIVPLATASADRLLAETAEGMSAPVPDLYATPMRLGVHHGWQDAAAHFAARKREAADREAELRGALADAVALLEEEYGDCEWGRKVLAIPASQAAQQVQALIDAAQLAVENAVGVNPVGIAAMKALNDALGAFGGGAGK